MANQMFDPDPVAHFAKAEEALRLALRRNPQAGPAHYYLAMVHKGRGHFKEAVAAFQPRSSSTRSLALTPKWEMQ